MKHSQISFLTALAGISGVYATTGQLGDATEYTNNPPGAAYIAEFGRNSPIKGGIIATTGEEDGTQFTVNFWNLPAEGGPFGYHIHVAPVSEDGNCTTTLAHLDPYIRGDQPPCDPASPNTCQVGDLSGKYGKATGTQFSASYSDPYVSLTEGVGAFFGNRSFVIHWANSTRLACASFKPAEKVLGDGWFANGGRGGPRGGNGGNSGNEGPWTRRESSAPTNTFPIPSATLSAALSWAAAQGISIPTNLAGALLGGNFGGSFGGRGRPVTTKAAFGTGSEPEPFNFPSNSPELSSIYEQYSSYYSGSPPWSTFTGAMSTVSAPSVATTSILADLPALPTAVTASGYNMSTSVLRGPTATRTSVPVVFSDDAAGQTISKIAAGIALLMMVLMAC